MGRFNKLEVGDVVLRESRIKLVDTAWGGYSVRVLYGETVVRVTATEGTTEQGTRFKRERGTIVGGEGYVVPDGYVNPHAQSALDKRPWSVTPQERLDELAYAARTVRVFMNELETWRKGERDYLKTILQTDHETLKESANRINEAVAVLKALRGGL